MRIRDVYLLNQATVGDSATVTVPLVGVGKILFLRVQYRATNGATSNTVGRLNGMVSSMQVVDGSNVLHSLSMREEQAYNSFKNGKMPFQFLTQGAAAIPIEEAIIDFRNAPGSLTWYLDTSRYQNPQLVLTHALTISATAGFATGTGKVTVIARVIDNGAPAQQGFVLAKEINSFASAASGDVNTDLPLDFPLAGILVQNPVDGQRPDETLSNFKLTADVDSFIPVNEAYSDLENRNADDYGIFEQSMVYLNDTAPALKFDLYYNTRGHVGAAGATGKGILTVLDENTVTVAATTGDAALNRVSLRGFCPHSSVYYPIGDGIDPNQVLPVQGMSKLQLKLTNAATGATPKVCIFQQHP